MVLDPTPFSEGPSSQCRSPKSFGYSSVWSTTDKARRKYELYMTQFSSLASLYNLRDYWRIHPYFLFLLLVVRYWSIAREPGSPTRVLRFGTISSDDQRQVSINDSNIINIDCDMQQNSGHKFVSDFNWYVTLSNSGSPGDPTLTSAHYSSFSMDGEFSVIFCDAQQTQIWFSCSLSYLKLLRAVE